MGGGKSLMSRPIDHRIVEMQFNNRQFESGIKDSITSLDQLRKGLNLSNAVQGLSNLNAAARNFSLSKISDGVNLLANRFSTLGIVGMTVLQNLTNAAVNAAKRIVASFTIDPIMAGFQEYETQMNAVQTILANTQGGNQKINQQAVAAIKESAAAASQAAINSSARASQGIARSHEERLDAYKKLADKELDVLENKHAKAKEALDKAIDQESRALNEAHRKKLKLYAEEYMQKLKVIDEDRYNKLKVINREIDALNDLTKSEERALELAEERKRIEELEERVRRAPNMKARIEAEQDLADLRARIARKRLLEERGAQIEELKTRREAVEEEYNKMAAQLKAEHDEKVEKENELHKITSDNLKEQHREKERTLNLTHKKEREFLTDQHAAEIRAISKRQSAAIGGLNTQQAVALRHIEERKNAELKALTEASKQQTKGSTLEDVNKALDELNTYADKTIYNFTEMTRNIGTFTAAGFDLDTSVRAIKGIANLAAVSGSNPQQAATAMYQLSQALATGTVRLMDWNSVVNAGMGGKVFQEALKETARVHGVEIDQIIMNQGSFRDSLQSGWLTAEVLLDTLSKFTGDLTKEQLKSQGYTEDQIISIIKLGDMANAAATNVRTFTQLMGTLREAAQSGWSHTWRIIIGDFEEAKTLLTGISNVVGGFIGRSADARNEMLRQWKALDGRADLIKGITNIFNGLGQVLKPIGEAFREIFPPITGERLSEITKAFKNLTENFKIGEETASKIKNTFKGVFSVFSIVVQVVKATFRGMANLIESFGPVRDGFLSVTSVLGGWVVVLADSLEKTDLFGRTMTIIGDVLGWFIDLLKNAFSEMTSLTTMFEQVSKVITVIFSALRDTFSGAFEGISFDNVMDFIKTVMTGGFLVFIGRSIKTFMDSLTGVTEGVGGFKAKILEVFDGLLGGLTAWQNQLQANNLLKIAYAVGILVIALIALSFIDPAKLANAAVAMGFVFAELFMALSVFNKMMLNPASYLKTMFAIGALIGMSVAILVLSSAITRLSTISPEEVMNGVVAVAALVAILVGMSKYMDKKAGSLLRASIGFIVIGVAIRILTGAIKTLGAMDTAELTKGLISLGIILLMMGTFVNKLKAKNLSMKTVFVFLALSVALRTMAKVVKDMGSLSLSEIGRGLLALGGALTIILAAMKLMPTKKVVSSAFAITIISGALLMLSFALKSLGAMEWDVIGRGLFALAGALLIISIAIKTMQGFKAGVLLLGLVVGAINLLVPSLILLGMLPLKNIGAALLALTGVFTILGVAGLLLKPLAPVILLLSGAILLLGLATYAIGAGLLKFAMGLTAIILLGSAGIAAIMGVLTWVISLIPIIARKIGEGLIIIIDVIANSGPVLVKALVTILNTLLDAIIEIIPKAVNTIFILVTSLLEALLKHVPRIIQVGGELIIALLKGLGANIEEITKAGVDLILAFLRGLSSRIFAIVDTAFQIIIRFINGLAEAVRKNSRALFRAVSNLISAIISAIFELMGGIINVGGEIIKGLIKGIGGMAKELKNAIIGVVGGAYDSAKEFLGISSPSKLFADLGLNLGEGFIIGINNMSGKVAKTSEELGMTAVDVMKRSLSKLSNVFSEDLDMHPTIRPVIDMTDVEKGLNSTFNKGQMIDVSGVINKAALSQRSDQRTYGTDVGSSMTDNSRISIVNNYVVRNDDDIRTISRAQKNLLDRYSYAKGVAAT